MDPYTKEIEKIARKAAREEIASLCGLILEGQGWGEALRDFTQTPDAPGTSESTRTDDSINDTHDDVPTS